MSRWTINTDEENKISKTMGSFFDYGVFITIKLNNGEKINGQIVGAACRNNFNGSNIDDLNYSADITIIDSEENTKNIDVLDIMSINKWEK